jgi:hypothetical protein
LVVEYLTRKKENRTKMKNMKFEDIKGVMR